MSNGEVLKTSLVGVPIELPRDKVGKRWKAMWFMSAGNLWNPVYIHKAQSLVVGRDPDGVGACVRLLQADYLDPNSQEYIPRLSLGEAEYGPDENDIARYLGLSKNNKSQLKFIDDSDILYLYPLL